MLNALVTIPLQVVCQLVVPGSDGASGNGPFALGTRSPEATTQLPNYAKGTTMLPDIDGVVGTSKLTMELPDGYIGFPDIGLAYKYYPNTLSWDSARKTCIESGGTLAEIDTFEKIKYAMMIKEWNRNLHVGIHRYFNSAEWTSLKTGLPLPMMPWGPESNVGKMDHRCVRMFADGTGLTANECDSMLHFICQIPMN